MRDDEIVWRRFGRNHAKPCKRPTVLTCAFSECQHADACQHQPTEEERYLTATEQQIMHRARRRSLRIIA